MSTASQNHIEATVSVLDEGLPEGWSETTVGDIVEIKYGKGLKKSTRVAGPVSVYGSNGVVGAHKVALTSGPTIILGRKGSIGAVHFSPSPCWPIDTTYFIDDFHGLDPVFITRALRNLNLAELDTSTAIPGLNRDDVYRQSFSLPPLAEQKRIVGKVEQLLAHVNTARERLARVLAILKHFRQAVLAGACSGRLTADWRDQQCENLTSPQLRSPDLFDEEQPLDLPEIWSSANVGAVCTEIVDCPHSTPRWTNGGVICLRTTNFKAGSLDLSDVRYVSESTYRQRTKRLEPHKGDVLYSREGGILGLSCMVPPGVRLCLGQRMMLMRINERVYSPAFLMHVLNSPRTNAQVRELTGGSASPHLNVAAIKQFPVPIPPLREQLEVNRRVEVLFKLADAIEKRMKAAAKRTERLTQVILAKAFRGELVTTEAELARREGREYEPAPALLHRIQAGRAEK